MKSLLQIFFILNLITGISFAQSNNCAGAINVCNNQLSEVLDDGPGTQECPTGGCDCMLAGEKNTRWFRIVIATGGTLEFTIRPYNGTADYDFSVWNQGVGGTCPSGARLDAPDRCNYASPQSPTGIRGTGNGNSNSASGNLFSNNMTVTAGQVIYIMIDNYDGTTEGFYLDFFGGTAGSGTGTTATFNCSSVNQCTTCTDADCKSYYFASPDDYSYDETAANGACHSNFGYATTKTATVCGTFTVPAPFTTVQFPINRGYEVITTNGANSTTCLNSAVISYQVWDNCAAAALTPVSPGVYSGLNNTSTYKVCKTVTVTGTDCWLNRVCLPYWTMVENDVVCSATPLTVNAAAISGSTAGASSDLDPGCTGYQDVYYSFVAPASGRIQVNVTPNASSDVKVNILGPMAGLDGGVNDCNLSCVAIDDSYAIGNCVNTGGRGVVERMFAFVIPGQTYYVWISGTLAYPTANFTVQVTETITSTASPTPGTAIVGSPDPIPSNDQCANATNLNLCVAQSGTNVGATAECTDPDPEYVDAISLENDVWYKWTAPANNGNSEITLTVTGVSCTAGAGAAALGIQFGIFRGTCSSLIPVSDGTTSLTFTPIAGQTYYFVVDGNAGAQCNFNIEVKRPIVTSYTCNTSSRCEGSSLNATMNIQYYGSNPGTRWAYCKSSTWNTPCTIDLDNPATYFVYNPAQGLPDPGCTPATYTFVGYILADNGATTIAPGYPRPQPFSTNCERQTPPCTFNIYPNILDDVTVTLTNCSQTVVANAGCSPAAPITITGTTSQTASPGTNGTFTPVTVTWNAPYNTSAPTQCATATIQNTYACPGPTGSTSCPGPELILGAAAVATNNNVAYETNDDWDPFWDWICADTYGYGVWFHFTAPASGNVNINLTNVGAGDDLDAVLTLYSSRVASDNNVDCDNYLTPDSDGFYSDDCATCPDMSSICQKEDQLIGCTDAGGVNINESLQPRGLNPGETYYIMVDGYESSTASRRAGNFSIQVVDAGGGPTRPVNDECTNAIDLSNIGCTPLPANNINATSNCSSDLAIPASGSSTENSVWYTYTPSISGPHTIKYQNASGYHCYLGSDPGLQFVLYTSTTNNCNGTFTAVPGTVVSSGTTTGSVTVNLTAGQKYYIFIDGYAGNECTFEFEITNPNTCCTADLGATEGGPNIVLCYGDDATIGVTANPIDFGENAGTNPVIGWQYSTTQPTVINPFNPANSGKPYYVGMIDTTSAGSTVKYFKDWQGYYPDPYPSQDGSTGNYPLTISGFPTGATFNTATDTITVCVYAGANYFSDMDVQLRAPDGTIYNLILDRCGSNYGLLNVCFSNIATTNVTAATCPGSGGELAGNYLPSGNWAGLNGEGINGNWTLIFTDDSWLASSYLYGWNIEIKKAMTVPATPIPGVRHGDLHIINNDPFKYGNQVFWLTPVTFIHDDGTSLYTDSCYHYGTPVKVTLLERVTTPLVTPTCAAPGDGSNGITIRVTSPTGGMPGLPSPTAADTFTVIGSGAASGIVFPTRPVGESEISNTFTVADGQAWNVRFVDNNGCESEIGGTYNQPNLGSIVLDTNVCDGVSVNFSTSNPIPLFSQYRVILDFDSYPQDVSWFIYDGNNQVVASGGGYGTTVGANTTTTPATINPENGPYRFVLYDGFDDGFGSGGGSTNNGGSNTLNFIRVVEIHADGTVDTLFSQNYAYCTPTYCVGPAASIFGHVDVNLGTPTGTFSTGVSVTLENNRTCTGTTVAGAITTNPDGTGTINTNAAGINPGASYSLQYQYTDQYGCVKQICGPLDVFPNITIAPILNCGVNPPTVSVNATCTGCNATYVAEYSYNGTTWTTATTANFQDIYIYAHVKNVLTGVIGCEVQSTKLGDCPTVLPIELIYIKANPIDNEYIKVSWATATENNTKVFELLRSTDAIHFEKITELAAAGNSTTTRNYFYDDHNVQHGVVYYYQVREVDIDNSTHLTNIVNAKLQTSNFEVVSIHPNPMMDNTTITIFSNESKEVSLIVYNELGELMKKEKRILIEGLNEWNVATEIWAKGVYYFIINNGEKPITKQVIKLN